MSTRFNKDGTVDCVCRCCVTSRIATWKKAIARLNMIKPEEVDEFNYQYIIADFEKAIQYERDNNNLEGAE